MPAAPQMAYNGRQMQQFLASHLSLILALALAAALLALAAVAVRFRYWAGIVRQSLGSRHLSCLLLDRNGHVAKVVAFDARRPPLPYAPFAGADFAAFYGPEFSRPFAAALSGIAADGGRRAFRYRLESAGRARVFEARLMPGRRRRHAVLVLSDVSAQVRAERCQAYNLLWFRTLFDKLSEAVILSDGERIIRGLNSRSLELYGWGKRELMDQGVELLYPDGVLPEVTAVVPDEENPVRVTEHEQVRKDGSRFPAELRSSRIRIENQVFTLTMVRDVSFQKELEAQQRGYQAQLLAQNAMRDKLFSIIAHDLRGPVGNLRSFMKTFQMDHEIFTPAELDEFLVHMGRSVEATWELLENLLSWVRNQFHDIGINRGLVGLREACSVVAGWLLPQAAAKQQSLEVDRENEHVVMTDQNMLQTVIRNLLNNAIKFSPIGGCISLRVLGGDGEAGIAVSDSGPGIAPDRIESLFLLRSGGSTPGSAGERGSGLGLVLCHEIVQRLGGRIQVDSCGEGSVFTVWLPAMVEGELAPAE